MKLTNQQKCAIGETAVVLELLKRGFDVININNSYLNYKDADLICMNPKNGKSVKVQVKTGTTQNILAGFNSEKNGIVPNLEEKIIGPWVFVFMNEKDFNMEFYILTKEETIELIKTSCDWYANAYNRKCELKSKPRVGVEVDWLEGGLTKATKLHPEYKSTLRQPSKGNWWKITKLLD